MLGLLLVAHSILSPQPAVLRVREPKSRTDVFLVGTMHYNPASIQLARSTVEEEGTAGRLRAVAVESCPSRWNATLKSQPRGSAGRWLCDNEMQAAAEAGEAYSVPLELADQTIEDTGRRASQLLALTFAQLATPWAGGWTAIGEDLELAYSQVWSADGLRASAFFNAPLLLSAPVSLVRYPLAIALKSPLLLVPLALLVLALSQPVDVPAESADLSVELLRALGVLGLETLVFGRLLLVGLLEERNYVLARNIRRACLRAKPGGSVVAVLGMAHCNGVAELLRGSRIM